MRNFSSNKFILFIFIYFTGLVFANTRLIIKYKPTTIQSVEFKSGIISKQELNAILMQPLSDTQINQLTHSVNIPVRDINKLATGAHLIELNSDLSPDQTSKIIQQIEKLSDIQYVTPERKFYITSTPELNPIQWDMQLNFNSTVYPNWVGDNFTGAWALLTNPGESIVVAVVDTGYTPNFNIISNIISLPNMLESYGYQFISDCRIAGSCPSSESVDTNLAPEPNALDLGDYVTQSEIDNSNGFFSENCLQPYSSWHGTHVTGTIVAEGDNESQFGILGGAYAARVVPVRVLGKCGGYNSDIINGVLWSVNQYPGINNPNPAQIINMSFGGTGACDAATQDMIDQVNASNAIAVVAAGNEDQDVLTSSPANCSNVISVAAKGPDEQLAFYSNYGATTITASGGNSLITPIGGIVSTIWNSLQAYNPADGSNDAFDSKSGTSMAAPHVSAAIADIISYLNANNKTWTLASIINILQVSASQDYNKCNENGCVTTGTLNVGNAISYVQPPAATSSAAGGCSMVNDGSDMSLIIIGLLWLIILIYRYYDQRKAK